MIDNNDDDIDYIDHNNDDGQNNPWQQPVSVSLVDCNKDENCKNEPEHNEQESQQLDNCSCCESIIFDFLINGNCIRDDLDDTYDDGVDSCRNGTRFQGEATTKVA
jgi:hypothetical protein